MPVASPIAGIQTGLTLTSARSPTFERTTLKPRTPRSPSVSQETIGERGVLGFNVMRSRPGDPSEVKVNPVWIPAIGDPAGTAAYSFLDTGARRGIAYEYRIEAVTPEGLVSRSEVVAVPSR